MEFIEKIPGIRTFFDFNENFSSVNPIDMNEIFNNPDREKYGYYWKINSYSIVQTQKYRYNLDFSGFFIKDLEDAAAVISLFNRFTYNFFKDSIIEKLKSPSDLIFGFRKIENLDKSRWEVLHTVMKKFFSEHYIPFRKFLALKRPEKCWISFSEDLISPKDPIYSDFLCGNPSLEYKLDGLKINDKDWIRLIDDGPLKNPEIPIIEYFFMKYPSSIKYSPKEISEGFELNFLGDFGDLGII